MTTDSRQPVLNLSIIIPHYNSARTLARLLATIPQKDDIEIIVVDDKSSPEAVAAVKALSATYGFRLIENNSPKKGPGVARNIGMEQAKGAWLFFADHDDFLLADFYQKVQPYFHSDNDVVFFSPTSQYPDGSEATRHIRQQKIIRQYNDKPSRKHLLQLTFMTASVWLRLIKAKFLKDHIIRFDETTGGEDIMPTVKMGYFMKRFAVSQDKIYCVTGHRNSFTAAYNESVVIADTRKIIERYRYLSEKLPAADMQLLTPAFDEIIIDRLKKALRHSKLSAWRLFLMFRKNGVPVIRLSIIAGIMPTLVNPKHLLRKAD